jgi:hypothetical protein
MVVHYEYADALGRSRKIDVAQVGAPDGEVMRQARILGDDKKILTIFTLFSKLAARQ